MIPLFAPKSTCQEDNRTAFGAGILQDELVTGLKSGDPNAARTLHQTYSAALYGIIRRLVQDDRRAENVLELTFGKTLLCIDQYNPAKSGLFTWISRIARQAASEELRHGQLQEEETMESNTRGRVTLKVVYTAQDTPGGDGSPKPADFIEPKYRMILNLVYFQGFSTKEIAERFSMPLQEVKTRLAIAVRQLRAGCIKARQGSNLT